MTIESISGAVVTRRGVLKGALGALALFTVDLTSATQSANAYAASDWVNGWIRVNPDNTVTIGFCAGELGQGIMTGLAQWAAEELKVDWGQVRTELVPPGKPLAVAGGADIGYGTGGSKGMINRYGHMRKAGLEARLKLEAASGGTAIGAGLLQMPDGTTKPYSAWVAAASALTVTMPTAFDPPYVQPADFRLVGKGTDVVRRVDIAAKTNGSAKFGLDVRIPGMVFAVVKNCPTWTGTLASVPAAPTGTMKVVPLKPWVAVDTRWSASDTATSPSYGTAMTLGASYNAIAVVASNTWKAKQAASGMSVSWTTPSTAVKLTSSTMLTEAKTLITSTTLTTIGTATTPPQLLTAEKTGDAVGAFTGSSVRVDQYYQLPSLPHVMMEVPNATVRVNADGTAECWVSTQNPPSARTTVAKVLGIPVTSVTVYPQLCGGGFGRRIDTDFIAQAAQVAKSMTGTPVMLVWPREEDLGHDQPRPAVYARARLGYDPANGGSLTAFNIRNVSQSPGYQRNPFKLTNGVRMPSADNVEGAKNSAYKRIVSNVLVDHVLQNSDPMTSVPTGYWRSVGASSMCFVVESAVDELALAAGIDPFTFRRNLIAQSSAADDVRMLKVMDAAKARIESKALPAGSARGFAISEAFGTKAAVAVEVTRWTTDLTLRVTRVAVAVDPGYAVNPDQVRAQMEGGVVHGISSALWGQLTWSSGKANSRNFSNTRVLRMRETPSVEVDVLPSGQIADMGGTGEVPVPMMAPAMANAWFRLTGTRVRALPFYPGSSMSG